MTGKIFVIGCEDIINTSYIKGNLEKTVQFIKNIQDCPVMLQKRSNLYAFDDFFKYIFYKLTENKKEEISEKLNKVVDLSKCAFDNNYKKGISDIHAIAKTDNLVYDFEKN